MNFVIAQPFIELRVASNWKFNLLGSVASAFSFSNHSSLNFNLSAEIFIFFAFFIRAALAENFCVILCNFDLIGICISFIV